MALIWSATAWAVTDGTITPQTPEQGTATGGAVVDLVVVKKTDIPNIDVRKPIPRHYQLTTSHGTVDGSGKVTLTYNEQRTNRDDDVALIILHQGGRTYYATKPLNEIGGGQPVFFQPVPPTATAGGPTSVPVMPGYPYLSPNMPFSGFGVSGFISGNFSDQTIREYLTMPPGTQTNVLSDSNAGIGGGATLFYNIPVAGPVTIGPFLTVNVLDQSTGRTFPGGFRIYTRDRVQFTFGPMFGLPFRTNDNTDVLLFLQLGASETQREFIVGSPASSDTKSVWGGTIGVGGMVHRPDWMIANLPVAAFGQISVTDWATPSYVNPLGSPRFTYRPELISVTAMAGITVMLYNVQQPVR
jgi:hypothetical protein